MHPWASTCQALARPLPLARHHRAPPHRAARWSPWLRLTLTLSTSLVTRSGPAFEARCAHISPSCAWTEWRPQEESVTTLFFWHRVLHQPWSGAGRCSRHHSERAGPHAGSSCLPLHRRAPVMSGVLMMAGVVSGGFECWTAWAGTHMGMTVPWPPTFLCRIHFHPKTVSSNDTFIQTRFHPMTLSSNEFLIQ